MKLKLYTICLALFFLISCKHDDEEDMILYSDPSVTLQSEETMNQILIEYLKFHEYRDYAVALMGDIFKHYNKQKPFPHYRYYYGVAKGTLFSINFQTTEDPNCLFRIHNHNTGYTKQFHGLGNVLHTLSKVENPNKVFIGNFIIAILKDNGIDISHTFAPEEAFTFFEFQPIAYENLARYTLECSFKNSKGKELWDKGIKFPDFLQDANDTKEALRILTHS